MKLMIGLLAAAGLCGCVAYPAGYYGQGASYYDGAAYYGSAPVYIDGSVGYSSGYRDRGYRDGGRRARADRDGDGVPNRYDRDRDGDGVPNRVDASPNDPRRR